MMKPAGSIYADISRVLTECMLMVLAMRNLYHI